MNTEEIMKVADAYAAAEQHDYLTGEASADHARAALEAALSAKQERISELEAQNAQLLGALRYFMSAVENSSHLDARRGIMAGAFDIAHAAIAAVQSNASTHELNSANSLE